MAIFIVLVDKEVEAVKKRLKEAYDESSYYLYHDIDNAFLVKTDDISEVAAVKLGIKGDENNRIAGVAGAVFKLNSSYAGYTKNALWEWLGKSDE